MQLADYLVKYDVRVDVFARAIGVSQQTVYRYLTGDRLPRGETLRRIKQATKGHVMPNDFFCQVAE